MTPGHKINGNFLNLPNILTYLRILVIPLIIVALLPPVSPTKYHLAFAMCLFAVITDYLDGIVARRQKSITPMGKLLDPLADKLLVSAVFIMLVPLGKIPAWITFLIISREMVITGLRSLAASQGLIIKASRIGKNKMVSQSIAMLLLLLYIPEIERELRYVGYMCVWVSLVLGYWSAIRYSMDFYKEMRRKL